MCVGVQHFIQFESLFELWDHSFLSCGGCLPRSRLELLRAASELVRVFRESLQTSVGLLYPARYPESESRC